MKIEVPDGHSLVCGNCMNSFYFLQSEKVSKGRIEDITPESCPKCGTLVAPPQFKITSAGPAIPINSSLTPRNGALRGTKKEIRFCIVDRKNYIISPTWKVWAQGEDVYIMSSASKHWKISLHQTGQDNIAIIPDYFPLYKETLSDRYILTRSRSRPYFAHFNRILNLVLTGHKDGIRIIHLNGLARRQKKSMLPIGEPTDPLSIQILYTKGHPDLYNETYIPDRTLIGILKASRNDYIVVTIATGTKLEIKESARITCSLTTQLNKDIDIVECFGEVLSGTFYIEQKLIASTAISYIT